METKWTALIVAGGSGQRMETTVPKQFLPLNGLPVLMHTISLFRSFIPAPHMVLVLPHGEMSRWKDLCHQFGFPTDYALVAGGQTRFHSVQNGLRAVDGEGLVAVHDGVRPFVSKPVVEACLHAATQWGCAIPAIRPTESVRQGSPDDSLGINRDAIWLVQTPQVFNGEIIKRMYQTDWRSSFTDDASVAEWHGLKIKMVAGNPENIKITTPFDLEVGLAILKRK